MTSRLIFMTSCDCETYYLYCAICQQTSEHLRINNVSPFFPLHRSDSSFSFFFFFFVFFFQVAVYIIQTVGIPHWGNRSVGFIFFFFFPTLPERVVEVHQDSVFHCMLLWDTFSVHGPPHFFIHTCLCVNSSPVSPLLHFFDRFLLP